MAIPMLTAHLCSDLHLFLCMHLGIPPVFIFEVFQVQKFWSFLLILLFFASFSLLIFLISCSGRDSIDDLYKPRWLFQIFMRKLNWLGSVLNIELVESSLSLTICVKVIIHTVKGFSFSYPYITHCQEQNPFPRLRSDGIHYILIDRNVCFWDRCQK